MRTLHLPTSLLINFLTRVAVKGPFKFNLLIESMARCGDQAQLYAGILFVMPDVRRKKQIDPKGGFEYELLYCNTCSPRPNCRVSTELVTAHSFCLSEYVHAYIRYNTPKPLIK
ncbi:hypothetical protein KIL84_006191 [Mauremys mutica]|uniref:Uncharacterized protein n=1 Tax=Mauremys mutica TaxID=74926 RepID=A0A9D3X090_9SAUR|nr:hypothetical protein KIL84_006191 [Mauremys mutica]